MTSRILHSVLLLLCLPLALFAAPDTSVLPGKQVDLSVTFTPGVPPASTFVWTKDGAPISGATAQTYSITSFGAANAGVYAVTIANSVGSTLSDTAKLILQALVAPSITTQPLSQILLLGSKLTLSVVATGTPAPTIQWYKGTTPISGATSATYVIAATVLTDSGDYTATATNSAGVTTSTKATVLIGTPPSGATLKITVTDPVTTGAATP